MAHFHESDELIRFISPDVYEDFALLNKVTKKIRSFTNHEMAEGMMNVSESRKFLLEEPEKIAGKIHNMVASQNS